MAVTLSVEAPQSQRRVTVAFRFLLAIPHLLYALVLWFVAFFAIVIAWFAALFTARVPTGIAEFVTRVLQYSARVSAYAQLLLTDRYPPFQLGPSDYPVEIELDPPDRLNRAAVLFRFVLQIPFMIVLQLLNAGMTIVLFFVWLIVLITGRLPRSAFEAETAVLRYTMRAYAFVAMLTSEYPRGLFGDRPAPVEPAVEPAVEPEVEPGAGTVDTDAWLDVPVTSGPPRITRFVLSRAAKNLVIVFLVLGAITQVGQMTVIGRFDDDTADELAGHHADLEVAVQAYVADSQSCATSGGPECARAANSRLIVALNAFQAQLRRMEFPDYALDDARAVDAELSEMISLLGDLQLATDITQYQAVAARLQQVGTQFDRDYESLYDSLLFD